MNSQYIILIFIISSSLFGQNNYRLDSIDKVNQRSVNLSGGYTTKLLVSKTDSSINLIANIRVDHRIFGYEQPNTKSKRIFLLSIFTLDVDKNPYNLKLGAYYQTSDIKEYSLKYLSASKNFIKVILIDKDNFPTIMYIETKWVKFE